MRKLISLGLFALMFSMFSSQVFAGKIAVCEEIKKDPAYKGLYGLCNAYWNADDAVVQAEILANFEKKAGTGPDDPKMPRLDSVVPKVVVCPCTDGVDTATWGMNVACPSDGTGLMGMFVRPVDNFTTFFTVMIESDVKICSIQQSPASFFQLDISMEESDACLTQLLLLCE